MGYFSNTDYVFICDHLLQVCLNKTENINNPKKRNMIFTLYLPYFSHVTAEQINKQQTKIRKSYFIHIIMRNICQIQNDNSVTEK